MVLALNSPFLPHPSQKKKHCFDFYRIQLFRWRRGKDANLWGLAIWLPKTILSSVRMNYGCGQVPTVHRVVVQWVACGIEHQLMKYLENYISVLGITWNDVWIHWRFVHFSQLRFWNASKKLTAKKDDTRAQGIFKRFLCFFTCFW